MRLPFDALRMTFSQRTARGFRLPVEIAVAVFLGLGWALFLFYAGAAYGADGTSYLIMAMAASIFDWAHVYPDWPPLFPVLIALARLVFTSPGGAATLVVTASSGFFLLLTASILRRSGTPSWVTVCGLLFLATNYMFVPDMRGMQSEAPFIAFMLLHAWAMQGHLAQPRAHRWLVLAAVAVALAALTRYAGYPFLGLFVAYLVLRSVIDGERRVFPLGLALLTLIPSALVSVRNGMLVGNIFGPRPPDYYVPLTEVIEGLHDLLNSAYPDVTFWIPLAAALTAVALTWREQRTLRALLANPCWTFAGYVLAMFLAYILMLLYASTTAQVRSLGYAYRMIVPVIPLVLILAVAAIQLLAHTRAYRVVVALASLALIAGFAQHGRYYWPYFVAQVDPYFVAPDEAVPDSYRHFQDYTFRISDTGRGIAKYLSVELERAAMGNDPEDLVVTGIDDPGANRYSNHEPSTLLLQRSVVAPWTVVGYDHVRIGDDIPINPYGVEYDLNVRVGGKPMRLRYRALEYLHCCADWPTLLADMARIVEQEGQLDVILFMGNATYEMLGPPPTGPVPARNGGFSFELANDRHIPPHRFLRWTTREAGRG